jgi:hypothetical protein
MNKSQAQHQRTKKQIWHEKEQQPNQSLKRRRMFLITLKCNRSEPSVDRIILLYFTDCMNTSKRQKEHPPALKLW